MRIAIPVLLLAFQLGAIIYARAVPTRYFCWAPYDTQTQYDATATVNGHILTPAEFRIRYRRPEHGSDNRSPQHIIDMLAQAEARHEKLGDKTIILMEYRVNGKDLRVWRWPESRD